MKLLNHDLTRRRTDQPDTASETGSLDALFEIPIGPRYSAKEMAKPIHFFCDAPGARSVHLTGDFSEWNPLPMERQMDGWWFLEVPLTHGHHQYQFLVDGQPTLDPRATGVGRNDRNQLVSLIAVS